MFFELLNKLGLSSWRISLSFDLLLTLGGVVSHIFLFPVIPINWEFRVTGLIRGRLPI